MKKFLSTLLALGIAGTCFADIQAPPNSGQTAIHKLGRGLSNVLYGITELPVHVLNVNAADGNSAGFGVGDWKSSNYTKVNTIIVLWFILVKNYVKKVLLGAKEVSGNLGEFPETPK